MNKTVMNMSDEKVQNRYSAINIICRVRIVREKEKKNTI